MKRSLFLDSSFLCHLCHLLLLFRCFDRLRLFCYFGGHWLLLFHFLFHLFLSRLLLLLLRWLLYLLLSRLFLLGGRLLRWLGLLFLHMLFLVNFDNSGEAGELVIDLELLEAIPLLLLLLEETVDASLTFSGRASFHFGILFVDLFHLCGNERPLTVAVLEHFAVGVLDHVDVETAAEDHVFVHGFGGNLRYFLSFAFVFALELEEGVAFRARRFLAARDAEFRHLAKLTEKSFELLFVETFGQVTDVDDSGVVLGLLDLQLVESPRELPRLQSSLFVFYFLNLFDH
jgi:hypothetical protein